MSLYEGNAIPLRCSRLEKTLSTSHPVNLFKIDLTRSSSKGRIFLSDKRVWHVEIARKGKEYIEIRRENLAVMLAAILIATSLSRPDVQNNCWLKNFPAKCSKLKTT